MRAFISHATHEDGAFANRLASDLESLGVESWIAPKSILPGEDWAAAIERGVQGCELFLLVMTPASLASDWVQKEIKLAQARREAGKCEIIPLQVAPTSQTTAFIGSIQFISFLNDYGRGLSSLGAQLGLEREAVENVAFYTASDVPDWLVEARPAEMVATLESLQQGLDKTIPPKRVGENLLIGSWNLRAFSGVTEKWEAGPEDSPKRDLRSLLFIAEVLARFDVVVLQEVRRNSSAMEQLIAAMNQYHDRWGYMYSEMGQAMGNEEQAAVVFDIRRLRPAGFQGPISAASLGLNEYIVDHSLYVTPFAHSFDMRGMAFTLLRLLFNYGRPDAEGVSETLREIRQWALREKAAGKSLITVGDFADRKDQTTKLIRDSRLRPPAELEGITDTAGDGSGLQRVPYYDQLAWFVDSKGEAVMSLQYLHNGGAFDFTKYVFANLPLSQMTWRISDHLPLWAEFSR